MENGFLVKYTYPNLLFISWRHYIPSYKRIEIKKRYGFKIDGFGNLVKEKEKEANQWAAQWLISDEDFNQLKSLNYKNPTVIKAFSKKINTHPSVIVGRLQRENLVEYNDINLNRLLTKLHF